MTDEELVEEVARVIADIEICSNPGLRPPTDEQWSEHLANLATDGPLKRCFEEARAVIPLVQKRLLEEIERRLRQPDDDNENHCYQFVLMLAKSKGIALSEKENTGELAKK